MARIPGLTGSFADILTELLSEGFEPPFSVSAISPGGTKVHARYDRDPSRCVGLSRLKQLSQLGTPLPIDITFVDSRGETARAVWTEDGVSLIELD